MSFLTLLFGLFATLAPADRLAVIQPAPQFSLLDHDGKPFKSSSLKGKVVLVSFIFTTCNGTCPATTHRLSLVQQALKAKGLLREGRIHFVSITLDPARDTPEVLRRYMRLYDVEEASWSFLTGNKQQVNKVMADWGLWARPAANAQLDHPTRVFLVDTQQRVREIYDLAFLKTPWVVEDIEELLKERR